MVLSGLLSQRVFASAVLAILFFVSPIRLPAAEPEEVAGTMPEDYLPELKTILAQAMKRSPEMIARDFDHAAQEARLTMAKAARLPGLGSNFDYGMSQVAEAGSNTSQSRNTGATYNFSAGQALFHWGAIKNEIEIARLQVQVGRKDTMRIYRETSVLLRRSYLSLIVQKARLRHARYGLGLVEHDLIVAQTKMKNGMISGAALAGEDLRLRETKLQVERVEAAFAAELRAFTRAAGIPAGQLKEDAIPAEIPRPADQEALGAAIAAKTLRDNARGTLEFEIYDLKLEEARRRQKVVATRLLPKFGLGASYSQQNNTSVNTGAVSQRAVTEQRLAISGSWAIFDGFATSGAKREAAANRRGLEHRKAVEIAQLLQTVQTLEHTLKLDAEQLDLTEVRHGIATEGQQLVAEGVKLGNVPKVELERGQANILNAYANSLEARASYLMRWTEFVAATGEDPVLHNLPERNARK